MLTTCPECELPVSDKATACPHCGFPLKAEPVAKRVYQKKRMRLPNGFGQISEIKSGNLRNRFRAMVTVGKDENGKPVCRILKPQGYFATYNEAYAALVEYNRNPYDLADSITVEELHEKWIAHRNQDGIDKSVERNYSAAWKRCSKIYKMRVLDVRPKHLKLCISEAPTPTTKKLMKMMLNLMFDYAVEESYVDKNYARAFHLDRAIARQISDERKGHVAFTDDEMCRLWENVESVPYADVVLIQCYMGWRPQELCLLRLADVNLEKGFIVGGMKTEAGKMRTVPIHDKVRPLIEQRYKEALLHKKDFLLNCLDSGNGVMTYAKYRTRFHAVMKKLGIKGHQPHDPRKTFITMCKRAGVDEYAIKHMVGHTINDITESVYTERDLEWLARELAKI